MRAIALAAALLVTAASARADLAADGRLSAAVDRAPLIRRSGRVEVRCARGALDDSEAAAFAALADRGVGAIAAFTGITPPRRVVIYVSPDVGISHTYPHYPNSPLHEPRMFVSSERVRERSAPYLHELVHAVAGDGGSMWLEEGFASWVAASVASRAGGYYAPVLSGPNPVVDAQAARVLSRLSPRERSALLADLRRREPPPFASDDERQDFYVLAHSFTKFLASRLGTARLVAVHRSALGGRGRIEGKSDVAWEKEWIAAIGRNAPVILSEAKDLKIRRP